MQFALERLQRNYRGGARNKIKQITSKASHCFKFSLIF